MTHDTLWNYVSFDNASRLPDVPKHVMRQFLSAFEMLAVYLPESEVRHIGDNLTNRDQEVIIGVLRRRGTNEPLHRIVRSMPVDTLRRWDRLEQRFERILDSAGVIGLEEFK